MGYIDENVVQTRPLLTEFLPLFKKKLEELSKLTICWLDGDDDDNDGDDELSLTTMVIIAKLLTIYLGGCL